MKKIRFGGKPSTLSPRQSADAWVNDRDSEEPTKRLTIDVPSELHRQIKSQCAEQGVKMADVIREMLERRFTPGPLNESTTTAASANPETQKIVSS